MHAITECRAEENYTLWLRFADGLEGRLYLGELVTTNYFRMLCDIDTFNRVALDPVENKVNLGRRNQTRSRGALPGPGEQGCGLALNGNAIGGRAIADGGTAAGGDVRP
jgi:hypothetical protein